MRQRLEEHAADDAEDRRVGADREAKRQDDGDREPAGAGEGTEGVSHEILFPVRSSGEYIILYIMQASTAESRRSSVRRELQERILSGALPPGTAIVPAEAASEFQVSATPMREALIELVRDGLLDNRANYGFTVRPLSVTEVMELYPLVWTLETLAVRTTLPGEDTLQQLEQLNGRFAKAADPSRAYALDLEWHDTLTRDNENRTLGETLAGLKRRIRRYETAYLRFAGDRPKSVEHHRRIISALRRRDVERAGRILEEHWRISIGFLAPWLDRMSRPLPIPR
jgi:DNA-binding GntR family transcriptional regulator